MKLQEEEKETLHNYVIEKSKIHVISELCTKFRDLFKLLAIAMKTSISDPKHLETNCTPFSHTILNIYYTMLKWK